MIEIEQLPEGEFVQGDPELHEGEPSNEPREGIEIPMDETVELIAKGD